MSKLPPVCKLCNEQFKSRRGLANHNRSNCLLQHICKLCQKVFKWEHLLKKHESSVHIGEKVSCKECGRTVSDKNNLQRHIQNVHLKTRKYSCNQCEKFFFFGRKHWICTKKEFMRTRSIIVTFVISNQQQ